MLFRILFILISTWRCSEASGSSGLIFRIANEATGTPKTPNRQIYWRCDYIYTIFLITWFLCWKRYRSLWGLACRCSQKNFEDSFSHQSENFSCFDQTSWHYGAKILRRYLDTPKHCISHFYGWGKSSSVSWKSFIAFLLNLKPEV